MIDNVKARIDSSLLESYLTTSEDSLIPCRLPHKETVWVHRGDTIVTLTGNGVRMTEDLAERHFPIRLRKPGGEFRFRTWPEGDTLSHIKANWQHYLACVHAMIREWHTRGCPRDDSAEHRFRDWAECVEYIVKNIFGLPSPTEDLDTMIAVKGDPLVCWLNDLGELLRRSDDWGISHNVTDLIHLGKNEELPAPGYEERPDTPAEQMARALGRQLTGKFKTDGNPLRIQNGWVHRGEVKIRGDAGSTYTQPRYIFSESPDAPKWPRELDYTQSSARTMGVECPA